MPTLYRPDGKPIGVTDRGVAIWKAQGYTDAPPSTPKMTSGANIPGMSASTAANGAKTTSPGSVNVWNKIGNVISGIPASVSAGLSKQGSIPSWHNTKLTGLVAGKNIGSGGIPAASVNSGNNGSIPNMVGGANSGNAVQAGTPASHQDYINKTRPGGMSNYEAIQRDRYQKALASNDVDLLNRLNADAVKRGYSLKDPTLAITDTTPVDQPPPVEQPPVDYLALARAELDPQFAEYMNSANQQIAGLNSQFANDNRITQDNRTMENLWFDRNNSPFTGQTDYKQATIGRERTLADANLESQLQSQIGGINQGVADRKNSLEQQIAARAYELEQEALANARADAGITGEFLGNPTLDARQIEFANDLSTKNYNRGSLESDREYEYRAARDKIADERYKLEFDEDVRRYGLDYALKKAQESRMLENTRVDNARASASKSGGSSSSSSKTTKYSYKQDPEFSKEITWINGNPSTALSEIQSNASELIATYGYDGYKELESKAKAAAPKK